MLLIDKIKIVVVLIGFIKAVDVWMIHNAQNLNFVLEHIGIFNEPFIDDLDAPLRIGRLLESSLVDGSISSTSDGLRYLGVTL